MKLMDGIWGQGRARGYAVTGLLAVVVFGGSATAADVLRSASDQQPAGTVFVSPTDSPTATDAPATPTPSAVPTLAPAPVAVAPAPVTPPAVAPRAATVNSVTEPAPQTPPAEPAAPSSYDPTAPFTDGAGRTYVPPPDPPITKIPGEAGYVPPAG